MFINITQTVNMQFYTINMFGALQLYNNYKLCPNIIYNNNHATSSSLPKVQPNKTNQVLEQISILENLFWVKININVQQFKKNYLFLKNNF